MTSKTFKSAESDNRELEVDVLFGNPRLLIKDFDGDSKGFIFGKADAPALALAILEAAGHGKASDSIRLMQAFDLIELHVNEQERATAEAREQAELEAEALAFFNAYDNVRTISEPPLESFVGMPRYVKDRWLAVARKARELAKKASK